MVERDQARPLAPASDLSRSEEDEAMSMHFKLRQWRCLKWCGVVTALLLILAVVVLVLVFTVFRVKDPVIKMNGATVSKLEFANGNLRTDVNVTLVADVSVKNPNIASFRYRNTTTAIYYAGEFVGEGQVPSGKAKARRTQRMNVTIDIIPKKILAVPSFRSDLSSGNLTMESYTIIGGRVRILNIIKKHVVVRLNCTITYAIGSRATTQDCKQQVSF